MILTSLVRKILFNQKNTPSKKKKKINKKKKKKKLKKKKKKKKKIYRHLLKLQSTRHAEKYQPNVESEKLKWRLQNNLF